MPRNPALRTLTVQIDADLDGALKEFAHRYRIKYDADALRLIMRDRFTAEGLLPQPAPEAPPPA